MSAETEAMPTIEDVVGSLSGFDEVAIEQKFKGDLGSLNNTMTARALVFVLERRAGKDDKAAYGESMRLTLKDVNARFSGSGDDEGNG